MEGKKVYRDLSPAGIRRNLEESLRRLQTDYIDIYYTHWQPLCEKYHCSTSNPVICLTAETMNKLHILCGARKPEQILENAQALKLQLEQCDCEKMMKDLSKLNFF